jgi:hypothetical protein
MYFQVLVDHLQTSLSLYHWLAELVAANMHSHTACPVRGMDCGYLPCGFQLDGSSATSE